MSYNLTALKESTNFYDLVIYANNSSNTLLVGTFLFGIFFIFILLFKNQGFDKAIAGSSFICLILSLYLAFAQLLSFYIVLAFLIILAFSVLFLYAKPNNNY